MVVVSHLTVSSGYILKCVCWKSKCWTWFYQLALRLSFSTLLISGTDRFMFLLFVESLTLTNTPFSVIIKKMFHGLLTVRKKIRNTCNVSIFCFISWKLKIQLVKLNEYFPIVSNVFYVISVNFTITFILYLTTREINACT